MMLRAGLCATASVAATFNLIDKYSNISYNIGTVNKTERQMLANTKQVRSVFNSCGIIPVATDKSRGNKDKSVRIVVGYATEDQFETARQAFQSWGYTNKVYRTSFYIRVKTQLA